MKGLLLFMICGSRLLAGPAWIDRTTYPVVIDGVKSFNQASRIELLVCLETLEENPIAASEREMAAQLGIKSVNLQSLKQWRVKLTERLLRHYAAAQPAQVLPFGGWPTAEDSTGLVRQARTLFAAAPPAWQAWLATDRAFYRDYLVELQRLAGLWPRISSEIALFDADETRGEELPDLNFHLTFDDGPTAPGQATDQVIAELRQQGISATFFLLGGRLREEQRLRGNDALVRRYAGMSVASHGEVHESFAKNPNWQKDLQGTRELIQSIFGLEAHEPIFFRPPYGQRTAEIAKGTPDLNMPIVLWNMDSQDWQAKHTAQAIADRVMTLMLLERSGVILFHDLKSRSAEAAKIVVRTLKPAGLQWTSSPRP